MPFTVVDRRLNGKNKSIGNRERFMRRVRPLVQKAIRDSVAQGGVTDIGKDKNVSIPSKDLREPQFHHAPGGRNERVHPGNDQYVTGDKIPKPKGGSSGGGNQASDGGEGMDDFVFALTEDEYWDYVFEDCELPNMMKRVLTNSKEMKRQRAGFSTSGTPNNIEVIRTLKAGLGRKIALKGGIRTRLEALEQEFNELAAPWEIEDEEERNAAIERGAELLRQIEEQKSRKIPFIDTFDLRYKTTEKKPKPIGKAANFMLMDVSGSMDEERKERSKRFFLMEYMFLKRNYEKVVNVFIRHTTTAQEVDEDTFFHSQENGGTNIFSALLEMRRIVDERFPLSEWNIYGTQASDGDDFDAKKSVQVLEEKILPIVQYHAYLQVVSDEQDFWKFCKALEAQYPKILAMQKAEHNRDIFPAFRKLFEKKGYDISAMQNPHSMRLAAPSI